MALKLNSASGSITISPEDGSGNANVTFPRAGYAGLDSPALTGTPTAPTATAGTSTTQVATTAFVTGEVAGIVDAAPATLNTLNELAAALGDDANFSTTVTNSIATKLPLAGGTMTGDVTYNDNVKAQFGTGNDLQIYHDGTNSLIADTGTGNLVVRATNFQMTNSSGSQYMLVSNDGGPTYLYHNGTNRLETSASGIDVAGTVLCDGVTVDGTLDIEEVREKVTVTASTSGTFNFNLQDQGIIFANVDQLANRTVNLQNPDTLLDAGQSVTCTLLFKNGSSAYYINAVQIDASGITPEWSGGSAPTAGNANSIDVYTFTIIKTAAATFTVLASQTQYA